LRCNLLQGELVLSPTVRLTIRGGRGDHDVSAGLAATAAGGIDATVDVALIADRGRAPMRHEFDDNAGFAYRIVPV
jgi:hypothetical protein